METSLGVIPSLEVIQKVRHSQNGIFWPSYSHVILCHFILKRSSPLCHSPKSDNPWDDKKVFCIYGCFRISYYVKKVGRSEIEVLTYVCSRFYV